MTGDWPGNGLAGNSGWAPKDRSKSAQKNSRRRWPWIFLVMLILIFLIFWIF